MPITLSAEEKEILQVGQEFAKLKNSPAYQKLLKWLDEYVSAAAADRDDVLAATGCGMDHIAKSTLIWHERQSLRGILLGRVSGIVEQAKQLAEEIAKEQEEANV